MRVLIDWLILSAGSQDCFKQRMWRKQSRVEVLEYINGKLHWWNVFQWSNVRMCLCDIFGQCQAKRGTSFTVMSLFSVRRSKIIHWRLQLNCAVLKSRMVARYKLVRTSIILLKRVQNCFFFFVCVCGYVGFDLSCSVGFSFFNVGMPICSTKS